MFCFPQIKYNQEPKKKRNKITFYSIFLNVISKIELK